MIYDPRKKIEIAFGVASLVAPTQYSEVLIMHGKNELNDKSCIGEGLEE